MRARWLLLLCLTLPTPVQAQTGWVCPICSLVSPNGTFATIQVHICSAHPHVSGCATSTPSTLAVGGSTATEVGTAVLGVVGALSSYFDQRAKQMQLSAIQQRYVEESRRQAAEALDRQRLQRQLQFERDKKAILDRMKGPKPVALQMKGAQVAGELKMKDPRDAQAVDVPAARAAADRMRARVDRLRTDLQTGDDGLLKFQRDNIDFRNTHPDVAVAPPMLTGPSVVRTADAVLVGGTGWVYGYNVPPGQGQLAAGAQANLEKQLSLAGISPDQFTSVAEYNMVIGVASTQENVRDLMNRVVLGGPTGGGDQLSDGGFSADAQPLYASLRGTQTSRLDCHSNGAMVCLAAISRGDVVAGDIRLFGPQITPSAVSKWEELLEMGKIKSLEINITVGDPIAPASYAFADAPKSYALTTIASAVKKFGDITKLEAFSPEGAEKLREQIQRAAPAIHVNVLEDAGCRQQLASDKFACHNMSLYQKLTTR